MQLIGAAASPGESAVYGAAHHALAEMGRPFSPVQMFDRLEAAYYNGKSFDFIAEYISRVAGQKGPKWVRSIASPAYRVAEFYAGHLWPGETIEEAFTFTSGSTALQEAVLQVWDWSNFGAKRNMFARRYAILGNLFIKVAQSDDKQRVFFRYLDPRWVTRHLIDSQDRGYLTYCRLDIPQERVKDDDTVETYYVTEIWDKLNNRFRRWEHKHGPNAKPDVMGTPTHNDTIVRLFGFDFIPIVFAPFKDDAQLFGLGAYQLQLDKIDEGNRLATELHSKLFRHNQPTNVVMANAVDRSGRPMPAPRIPGFEGYMRQPLNPSIRYGTDGAQNTAGAVPTVDVVDVGDEQWIYLPGAASIESLVPKIAWDAALSILVHHLGELAEDLPEMVYAQIRNMPGDASGEALRIRLMAAVDKALDARANIIPALIRLNKMAVTIGQNGGLFGTVGTFKDKKLDHTLRLLPVIPTNEIERLDADGKKAANAVVKDQAGWPRRMIFIEAGYTEAEATEMVSQRDAQNQVAIDLAQRAFDRGNDLGDGSGGNTNDGGDPNAKTDDDATE